MRVIVACFGNVLRADDGIGVSVAHHLVAEPVPPEVEVMEVGIGGIHLVQELFDPTDALVIVDAVDVDRPAGTVVVVRPEVRDLSKIAPEDRGDELADMHYATPERAMMLARSLGVLPDETLLVGCQVTDPDLIGEGLSPELRHAVRTVADEVRRVVRGFGVDWPDL